MEQEEIRKQILKVSNTRKHSVNNSLGVYDAYKWIRKNKWLNIGQRLTEHQFYYIIRNINNLLVDSFLESNDIELPCRMGTIELRKSKSVIKIDNGKLVTNLPIDWNRTLKLWSEDEEAYKERTLVKMEEKELFKIYYNKSRATFENKSFISFKANRDFKIRLKNSIKNNLIDAFTYG